MIPAAPRPTQPAAGTTDWKRLWREAVRDPAELLALLDLTGRVPDLSAAAAAQFPLRVPRGFVARMRPGDPLSLIHISRMADRNDRENLVCQDIPA